MTNKEYAEGLRRFADAVEGCEKELGMSQIHANHWCADAADLADSVRAVGGKFKKAKSDDYYIVRQDFGAVRFDVFSTHHRVCERVVTTETVEIPDPDVKITVEVSDPDAPTITVEREVVEWVCPDSILAVTK